MRLRRIFAGVGLGIFLLVSGSGPASAQEDRPVSCNFLDGMPLEMGNPGGMDPGSNDWTCKPSVGHPNPAVLSHGTGGYQQNNWGAYAPPSANEGYCVFASTYGTFGDRSRPISAIGRMMPIEQLAERLRDFVDRVLATTGAREVDLVRHSQGMLMPAHYVQRPDGQDACAANFCEHAAIAPSSPAGPSETH